MLKSCQAVLKGEKKKKPQKDSDTLDMKAIQTHIYTHTLQHSPSLTHNTLKKNVIFGPGLWQTTKHNDVPKSSNTANPTLIISFLSVCQPRSKYFEKCCLVGNTVSTAANLPLSSCPFKSVKTTRWQHLVCFSFYLRLWPNTGNSMASYLMWNAMWHFMPDMLTGDKQTKWQNKETEWIENIFLNGQPYFKVQIWILITKHLEQGTAELLTGLLHAVEIIKLSCFSKKLHKWLIPAAQGEWQS